MDEHAIPGAARPAADGGRFTVLSRSTLPEEIASRLLQLIKSRELRPGDKLPPERTLASTMEVSRPVLREALRALSIMKVVEIRQGSGTYITSLEPKQLVSHLDFAFGKDSLALVQVLEARRVVEVGNAALAAERADATQIRELESIVEALADSIDDADRFSDLDIEFHSAVCAATGNFLLTQFMSAINTLAKVSRERTGSMRAVREATVEDHRRVVEALSARDPGRAADAMRCHLDHVERALEASLEANGGPASDALPETPR